jgi:hypothetical protein
MWQSRPAVAKCPPDDEKSQKALKLAQGFSKGLSSATVAKCKAEALSVIESWEKV